MKTETTQERLPFSVGLDLFVFGVIFANMGASTLGALIILLSVLAFCTSDIHLITRG